MILASVLTVIPEGLKRVWLDTPRWKVIAVLVLTLLSVFLLMLLHRAINRVESEHRTGFLLRRAITPVAILVLVRILKHIIAFEINVSGAFSAIIDAATTVVIYAVSISVQN